MRVLYVYDEGDIVPGSKWTSAFGGEYVIYTDSFIFGKGTQYGVLYNYTVVHQPSEKRLVLKYINENNLRRIH